MWRRATGIVIGFCFALSATAQNGHTNGHGEEVMELSLGDRAPRLIVDAWTKGKPFERFEKDRVYVVEFWATWCPPCLTSIPHLTKLQKQYKDKGVTIIGVTSEDGGQDRAKIESFVDEQGDKMDYTVVLDKRNRTSTSYMVAARQTGIPTAFIVDRSTRIAWIGHPMAGLDRVLEQVVAGTYDLDAELKKEEAARDEERRILVVNDKVQEALARVNEAWNEGDKRRALDLIEEVLDIDFERRWMLAVQKFEILHTDLNAPDEAADYATGLIGGRFAEHADGLQQLAWTIILHEGDDGLLNVARSAGERADALTSGESPIVLDTLARVHFELGNIDDAIRIQSRAVELADEDMRFELELALDRYKAAKGGAG